MIKAVLPKPVLEEARKLLAKRRRLVSLWRDQHLGTADSALECYIAYNSFGGYCVPLSSHLQPAAQTVSSGEVYEPATIQYMIEHVTDGDIIHAGTYFGDFIPALSRACAEDAKIWAFEPNPENYRCAAITIAINGLDNVEIRNAGLGAKEESLHLSVSNEFHKSLGGASRFTDVIYGAGRGTVDVNILRIDDVVTEERKVDILQLDVEGFEEPALAGGIETINRCKPILVLEGVPAEKWLSENLFPLGYRRVKKVHANTVFAVE